MASCLCVACRVDCAERPDQYPTPSSLGDVSQADLDRIARRARDLALSADFYAPPLDDDGDELASLAEDWEAEVPAEELETWDASVALAVALGAGPDSPLATLDTDLDALELAQGGR